jgi:hypothetical protein
VLSTGRGICVIATLLVLAAIRSPFAFAQNAPVPVAVLSGRLVDNVGCPVIDAVLRLQPGANGSGTVSIEETRSDSEGTFSFKPVAAGRNYWLRYDLSSNGGSGGTTITLDPAGTHVVQRWPVPWSPLDFTNFDFTVTDLDDLPVRGALVIWHRLLGSLESDCVSGYATTDAHGRAVAPALAPGRFRVTVVADGFALQTIDTTHEWGRRSLTVRLLTPEEAEKAKRPTAQIGVCPPEAPSSIPALVAVSDAIVVARVVSGKLEADYTSGIHYPTVRTLYDIALIETIKPHQRLTGSTGTLTIVHGAGEVDLGDMIVLGIERTPMRQGEVYVMFLVWNEHYRMLMPTYTSAFLANITTGVVTPMRRTREISPLIASRRGMPAAQFIQEIRSLIR